MNHDLKTWPPFFEDVLTGAKTFELRRDDRGYTVGDVVTLREWAPADPRGAAERGPGDYTGRTLTRSIGYIVRDAPHFGLAPGFAILGLAPAPKVAPTLDLPPWTAVTRPCPACVAIATENP